METPRVHPEHGEVILECNPHLQMHGGGVSLRYVAGFNKGPNTPIVYRYCSLGTDWTLGESGEWVVGDRGFSAVWIEGTFYRVQKTPQGDRLLRGGEDLGRVLEFQNIYRVCPVHGESGLIITGDDAGQPRSYVCSADFSESREIKNMAGEPVYKCTLLGDRLVYTVRHTGGVEQRSLVEERVDVARFG